MLDPIVFAAALASAVLHALWNALVKNTPDGDGTMAATVVVAGLLAAPLLLVAPFPAPASWPFILLAVVFANGALRLLTLAYERGAFALAYPISRGASPLIVAGVAVVAFGDPLGTGAFAGIALIAAGIAVLALQARSKGTLGAVGLALGSAGFLAAATLGDATGVRLSESLLGYGAAVALLNAVTFAVRPGAGGRGILTLVRANLGRALIAAVLSMLSYWLVLWAFTAGPTAPVAALRETSVVFATLLAAAWLREPVGAVRWSAVALVAAGAIALRLA